jgi:spermidine synthase
VTVDTRDVGRVVATSPEGAWDAILLDVDNGPSAWCLDSNAAIYGKRGLTRLRAALAPGGVLGVWSAHPDADFVRALGRAGFSTEVETVRSRGGKGFRHTIFLARLGGARRTG